MSSAHPVDPVHRTRGTWGFRPRLPLHTSVFELSQPKQEIEGRLVLDVRDLATADLEPLEDR